jgi:hypothetical protein
MALPQTNGHAAASLSSSLNPPRLCRRDPFSRSRIPSNDISNTPENS